VLAEQAPDLHDVLQRVKDEGAAHMILDGKAFSADRCSEKTLSVKGEPVDLWYSGKAREHGGNIQALCTPDGFHWWVSDVEPGSLHDLTVAREHVLGELYWAASDLDLPTLADGGYDGAGIGVYTPVKHPPMAASWTWTPARATPCCVACGVWTNEASLCSAGRWRSLWHLTARPSKIGDIVKAAPALTPFEHGKIA
jgi:DDE superfamily endonuclease